MVDDDLKAKMAELIGDACATKTREDEERLQRDAERPEANRLDVVRAAELSSEIHDRLQGIADASSGSLAYQGRRRDNDEH